MYFFKKTIMWEKHHSVIWFTFRGRRHFFVTMSSTSLFILFQGTTPQIEKFKNKIRKTQDDLSDLFKQNSKGRKNFIQITTEFVKYQDGQTGI